MVHVVHPYTDIKWQLLPLFVLSSDNYCLECYWMSTDLTVEYNYLFLFFSWIIWKVAVGPTGLCHHDACSMCRLQVFSETLQWIGSYIHWVRLFSISFSIHTYGFYRIKTIYHREFIPSKTLQGPTRSPSGSLFH